MSLVKNKNFEKISALITRIRDNIYQVSVHRDFVDSAKNNVRLLQKKKHNNDYNNIIRQVSS